MTLQDVPHWRLQEQVPKSPAPLSPHHEPQPESAAAPRTTAPVTRPDTPPQSDAPRIPSPSPPTAAAPHAPSPTTASKDGHQQYLLAAPAVSISTATTTSAAPSSDSSTSSVTAQIPQDHSHTNESVSDSACTGGVKTAVQGGSGSGSFHSSSSTAGASSEQPPTTVPRVPGSSTPTADGPRPALNRELQQLQQPERPPQRPPQVPAPSPTSIPDAANSAATSTSTSTSNPANATHSATDPATTTITSPTTTTTTSARSNFRDPIRWRDPITVHYDSDSGHAHPARLHAQPAPPSSSASSQLPPPAQLKYESSRQHQEPPTSQPPTQSQPPAQAQSQSSAHAPPVQARQDRHYHYPHPSSQSHPQPPLQPAPAPVPAIQPPPVRSQRRQSYEHHLQASQYQHQAPPTAHPQQHYQHSYLLGAPQHHPPPPALSQQQYHPCESRYSSRNDGLISRPVIMDPPRSRPVSQPPPPAEPPVPSSGFPSPITTHAHLNKKFADDCTRLTYAIQQSTPDAVRRVFRDNWEKCMLGTEFHQAFIVSPTACFHLLHLCIFKLPGAQSYCVWLAYISPTTHQCRRGRRYVCIRCSELYLTTLPLIGKCASVVCLQVYGRLGEM